MNELDHPGLIQCFHHVLVNVWITGESPQQWKDAIILLKPKDRSDRNNYGGISLVAHVGKGLLKASFSPEQLRRGSANTP